MRAVHRATKRRRIALIAVATCAACLLLRGHLPAETVTLKNGMRLDGSVGQIATIGGDPLSPTGAGAVKLKQIVLVDDQLRRVFVGSNQIAGIAPPVGGRTVKIEIPQRVALVGRSIGGVGPIVRVTPFDDFGRRIFTMRGSEGNVDIVQGITEITPQFTKVEALQGQNPYVWSMRIATSSIPRDQLSRIIYRVIDTKNADERLNVVRLYLLSERFQDARAELEQLIKEFPDLAHLQDRVKELHQQSALRLIKEIELRRDAGQYRLAVAMLEQFPKDGVAGETLLKVREMLSEIGELQAQGHKVLKLLAEHTAALKDDKTRTSVEPIVAEISRDLNVNTLDRLADYLRLADDASLSAEQKLSLAISGWLLGSGSGLDNLAVSNSLVEVRERVRKYLRTTRRPERDLILSELQSLEGATPENIAKIIAHMRPPLETQVVAAVDAADPAAVLALPPGASDAGAKDKKEAEKKEPAPDALIEPRPAPAPDGCEDEEDILGKDLPLPVFQAAARADAVPGPAPGDTVPAPAPEGAADKEAIPNGEPDETAGAAIAGFTGAPGNFELTVAGLPEDPQIKYFVQLPPEYDPYRRYPCVVTLNGAGTTPQQQIDWWAGAYNKEAQSRFGQATRHGYIVVAPLWAREHQREYEYTVREHAAVLFTLRDAVKRFSIDTDRVFLSGHSMGGDAVWDIGLAHPDLWAGVIPIVAKADKYVTRYWENGRQVPMYFVVGERDLSWLHSNVADWDRYLRYVNFDTMIVMYLGRGHEHFHDEIQNIFDWMNLHKRNFFLQEFTAVALRPWDSFFWWVEVSKLRDANQVLPAEYGKKATPAKTEAKVLSTNGVHVTSGAQKVTVWLSPEIVRFGERMTININGRRESNVMIQPSVATLLEDVRTRGDRQHPFWAKVEN